MAATQLIDACKSGDCDLVERLIANGADVNEPNENGTTPLMFAKSVAFRNGDLSIMNLLISRGADINARDKYGKTALDYTFERSAIIIKILSR